MFLLQHPNTHVWSMEICPHDVVNHVTGNVFRKSTQLMSNVASLASVLQSKRMTADVPSQHNADVASRRDCFAGWYMEEFVVRLLSGLESFFQWEPVYTTPSTWTYLTSEAQLTRILPVPDGLDSNADLEPVTTRVFKRIVLPDKAKQVNVLLEMVTRSWFNLNSAES